LAAFLAAGGAATGLVSEAQPQSSSAGSKGSNSKNRIRSKCYHEGEG